MFELSLFLMSDLRIETEWQKARWRLDKSVLVMSCTVFTLKQFCKMSCHFWISRIFYLFLLCINYLPELDSYAYCLMTEACRDRCSSFQVKSNNKFHNPRSSVTFSLRTAEAWVSIYPSVIQISPAKETPQASLQQFYENPSIYLTVKKKVFLSLKFI